MTQAMADSIEKWGLFSQQDRDHTSFKAVPDNDLGSPMRTVSTQPTLTFRIECGTQWPSGPRCVET